MCAKLVPLINPFALLIIVFSSHRTLATYSIRHRKNSFYAQVCTAYQRHYPFNQQHNPLCFMLLKNVCALWCRYWLYLGICKQTTLLHAKVELSTRSCTAYISHTSAYAVRWDTSLLIGLTKPKSVYQNILPLIWRKKNGYGPVFLWCREKNETDSDFSPVVDKECHGVLEKI